MLTCPLFYLWDKRTRICVLTIDNEDEETLPPSVTSTNPRLKLSDTTEDALQRFSRGKPLLIARTLQFHSVNGRTYCRSSRHTGNSSVLVKESSRSEPTPAQIQDIIQTEAGNVLYAIRHHGKPIARDPFMKYYCGSYVRRDQTFADFLNEHLPHALEPQNLVCRHLRCLEQRLCSFLDHSRRFEGGWKLGFCHACHQAALPKRKFSDGMMPPLQQLAMYHVSDQRRSKRHEVTSNAAKVWSRRTYDPP